MINATAERIVVLDTETTGMNKDNGPHYEGHRIIEIGAVEMINRKLTGRYFHVYIRPDREIDPEAIAVHGITDAFLKDKPTYAEIHEEFVAFVNGAEMIAHNAPFDVGFIDHEFRLLNQSVAPFDQLCQVTDTLVMAKRLFPGKRNNLDVLCGRYGIDNSHRTLHGALLDAEILADVYLFMTGGQTAFALSSGDDANHSSGDGVRRVANRSHGKVILASNEELSAHQGQIETFKLSLWQGSAQ